MTRSQPDYINMFICSGGFFPSIYGQSNALAEQQLANGFKKLENNLRHIIPSNSHSKLEEFIKTKTWGG